MPYRIVYMTYISLNVLSTERAIRILKFDINVTKFIAKLNLNFIFTLITH